MRFICVIAAAVVLISTPANSEEVWEDLTSNLKDISLNAIAVNPQNPEIVYCGSSKAVYKSVNAGGSWRQVLGIGGETGTVNFISLHPQDPRLIFVATENGLFKSSDSGANWRKLFSGIGELERDILCIALHPQNYRDIYIGTQKGLFWSSDGGESWDKAKGVLSPLGNATNFVALSPANYDLVYVATTAGVFKGDREKGWERVFVTSSELNENFAGDEETFSSPELVTGIAFNPSNPQNLYIGTRNGLFASYDGGSSWSKLSEAGLISRDIRFILTSPRDSQLLYAATSRGVFEFSHNLNQWRELYQGITSRDVRSLALDSSRNLLWAATEGGVFRITLTTTQELFEPSSANQMDAKGILNYFSNEPTIGEIQEAAISYAEVIDPRRIRNLREGARYRALLPNLDVDYYKTIYSGTGIRSGSFWVGPRDWSVGLSWDLGDLIWDEQQRLIDSQTRLMVQLRDDILDEVTRLYFERRRLQIELLMSPLPQRAQATDIKEQVEKELRLQELTADIDALTGGYLSERLSKVESKKGRVERKIMNDK